MRRRQQNRKKINLDDAPLLGNTPLPSDSEIIYARWYTSTGQLSQYFGSPPPEQLDVEPEFQTLRWPEGMMYESFLPMATEAANPPRLRQITLPVHHQGQVIGYLQMAAPMTVEIPNLRSQKVS